MTTEPFSSCPLCGSAAGLYHADGPRRYFHCAECTLIHVDPDRRLSASQEQQHLDRRHRRMDDAERAAFLQRLVDPIVEAVPDGSHGLEFGAGPDATLGHMLTERGRACGVYDSAYFPDQAALERTYDFVVSAEVIERAAQPAAMFAVFGRLLRPRGIVGVLTRFYDSVPFRTWWYRREPLRVCFYGEGTMRWIALQNRWKVRFPAPGVALFKV